MNPDDRNEPTEPAEPPPPREMDRDPVLPPQDVIDQVQGRVLDPSTALVVKGVRPGPRCTSGIA